MLEGDGRGGTLSPPSSARVESHPVQNTAHVSKALDDARHGIVAIDLILKIDKPFVVGRDQRLKDAFNRHDAVTNRNLALFAGEAGQVFHVNVEEPRAYLMNGLDHIGARAHTMAHI